MLLWGCSTTNHAVLPTMAYHDITSHYNAYFNTNEKLTNTLKTVEASHKDKFDSVISVYFYSDPKDFAASVADLDDVIKRTTMAIQIHNISNWSDDHMLLIGISSYLKGDYDKASGSFKYITTEFKEGVDYVKVMKGLGKRVGKYVKAKKKVKKPEFKEVVQPDGTKKLEKVDNRPEYSLWVHEPARAQALIWLIKTYTRTSHFDEASSVVTYVRNDDKFYKNLDPDLELADADLQVSSKNYKSAIAPLEKYLGFKKIKKSKKKRVRPLFVLAQCYEAVGNNAKAIETYKLVLKSRPNYDMEFYAKLKMARIGRGAGAGNADMRNLLARMAKDGKYRDYYDQIYYELALLSLLDNNRDEARKFLHKSIDNSTTNDDQKALSYLKLAELDYNDENYVSSKFYYDSTLNFMAKNDQRYPDLEERDRVLDNLVKQLNIIAEEDSLQKLAALPEAQRQRAIKDILARKEREEEEKKEAEETAKQQQQLENFKGNNPQNPQQQQPQGPVSNWYFYNTAARATGYNDFIKKWGRRKLEENWRRKNKTSVTADDTQETNAVDSLPTEVKKEEPKGTPEEQLEAGLPTTPEKLEKSNDRLIDAYYNAGTIYKDGLEAYDKAQVMFETLVKRFPKNKVLLESYYYLYLIAQKLNNATLAESYKAKILAEFPESVIAKILKDPNYVNASRAKEQEINAYYESAYNDFANNRLDSAWLKAKLSDVRFKPNPLAPKFELLLALILARQNRLADYVQALNKIINKSTDIEIKKTASDLLAALNKSSLPQIDLSQDSLMRDSLNALYKVQDVGIAPADMNNSKPDSAVNQLQAQLDKAKELAKQKGVDVKVDSTAKPVVAEAKDTVAAVPGKPAVAAEDTTSPYVRNDAAVHLFLVYIKDPAVTPNATTSVLAKINAFNSTQYEVSRLQTKQVIIDSKNKLINVRQFKTRTEAMDYFNVVRKQDQLFSDMQAAQYELTVISTVNFATLLTLKGIDEYQKFFHRVYGK